MTALLRRISVALLAVVMATVLAVPTTTSVEAQSSDNARYASIVVDAQTGEVLFARLADSQRYPASVTKIMTLYLTFDALAKGKVSLDDTITVSPLAASQPPSKLGLAAGRTITLDSAMRATAVRSANDMAMAIAEHVGGSQAQFAAMATLKAQELGMTQTRYVNPNGLPDSRQVTSARDLAILARAVMRDFPQYYSYFGLHDWAYNGREYHNTNGLLLSGNGYDGIKTGFTNASGFNLAASAVRNNRRIIVIVMGGRSTPSRNAHVAELMNTGFEVENRRAQGETIQVAQTFFEQRGFGVGGSDTGTGSGNAPIAYASIGGSDDDEGPGIGSNEVAYTALPTPPVPEPTPVRTFSAPPRAVTPSPMPYSSPAPVPTPSPARVAQTDAVPQHTYRLDNSYPPAAPVTGRPAGNLTAALNSGVSLPRGTTASPPAARRATPAPARAAARAPAGRWAVQVGAFRDESVADNWLTEINRRFRSQFTGAERTVVTAGEWHRSRFTGMTEAAATSACSTLAERHVTCVVVRPE